LVILSPQPSLHNSQIDGKSDHVSKDELSQCLIAFRDFSSQKIKSLSIKETGKKVVESAVIGAGSANSTLLFPRHASPIAWLKNLPKSTPALWSEDFFPIF